MDNLALTALVLGFAFAASALAWLWIGYSRHARAKVRRARGYELIHALKAYSAWSEYQRDQPVSQSGLDELASPEPLTRARKLQHGFFPQLSEHLLRLLQAHSRMVEYLCEQDMLRLSRGEGWKPAYQNQQYQQLRGAQEELIDEMIVMCRESIGEAGVSWQATGSDFAFTNSAAAKAPMGEARLR